MADDQYRGEKVEINFDGRRCIHSRMCVLVEIAIKQFASKGLKTALE